MQEVFVITLVFALPVVLFGIPAYLVYRSATARGTEHRIAWPLMAVFGGIPFLLFYWTVREDIGEIEE